MIGAAQDNAKDGSDTRLACQEPFGDECAWVPRSGNTCAVFTASDLLEKLGEDI